MNKPTGNIVKSVAIGIIGYGTVGQGVVEVLQKTRGKSNAAAATTCK